MMDTSSRRQKQKLTLLKPRHLARSIVRQFIPLPASPLKRLGLVSAGLLTGVGLPALVFASQQHGSTTQKVQTTGSSTVTIHSTASSRAEGAASVQGQSLLGTPEAKTSSGPVVDTNVVINGETVPLGNDGTVTEHITNEDGSHVDINVTIDHTTTSSSSSNNTTDISIDSSSSTSSQNITRGSPRR